MKRVKPIVQGPNADFLLKLISLLYDRAMMELEPEYFSTEELRARIDGLVQKPYSPCLSRQTNLTL